MKKIIMLVLCLALINLISCAAFAEVKVAKVDDLTLAKVGVQAGSVAEALVQDLFEDAGKDKANIMAFDTVFELVAALKDKSIDAAVIDEVPARYFITEDESLSIVPEPVQSEMYAIGFKKGSNLVEPVNKALDEIINDGTLALIIAKYLNEEMPSAGEIDFNKGAAGGKLWVGCAAGFPPYAMRNEGGFIGIDIELSAEIAKRLNKELVIADYRFDMLPEVLEAGRIDMICSALTVNEKREKVMDFSRPYDADQEVILVLK